MRDWLGNMFWMTVWTIRLNPRMVLWGIIAIVMIGWALSGVGSGLYH